MPRRIRSQNWKIKAQSIGRAKQMVELNREPEAQDDGAEQLPELKESRALEVQCGAGKFGEGGGWAESPDK